MKTVGDRIRQAREALGWSAHTLALRVGYKQQSGISNLENRATGSGGNKIGAIAQALGVPVDWLLNGPDGDTVPQTSKSANLAPICLADALAVLSDHLKRMDGSTRRKSMLMVSDLEKDPDSHAQVASAIEALMAAANRQAA